MLLTQYRFYTDTQVTFSLLYVDGVFSCFVLEDAYHAEKIYGKTRIPAGEYQVVLEYSPKFSPRYGHKMLTPQGVPSFSGVRFHKGNTAADTEGCLLLGLLADITDRKLQRSHEGYEQFYGLVAPRIERGEECRLLIVDEVKR